MNKSLGNVLITGGTSGIGLELARLFLQNNYRVGVVGLTRAHAIETQKEFAAFEKNFRVYCLDLADNENILKLKEHFSRDFGTCHILVNNVGYAHYETFEAASPSEIQRLTQVNFISHMLVTKAFLPEMKLAKSGKIINISSVAGSIHITPNAVYMACKQAMNAWTVALHCELNRFNIQCKVICPGRIQTNFFRHESFLKRKERPESVYAMPLKIGAAKIYKSIFSSGLIIFIPGYYALMAWAFRSIPLIESYFLHRLLIKRIDDLYSPGDS